MEQPDGVDIFDWIDAGGWYRFKDQPELQAEVAASRRKLVEINALPDDAAKQALFEFLPGMAIGVQLMLPITAIEYPSRITIGAGTFVNSGLQTLSAGRITIGRNCFLGPNINFYTPNHELYNLELRREGWQYDAPVTIGDDCWLGGSVVLLPGVTLGNNVVVGAGAVVTKSFGSNIVIAGNPAKVLREL
jgi:maltose O-acetyltransferase